MRDKDKTLESQNDNSGTHSVRRMVRWVALNTVGAILVYLALFDSQEWAGNVFKFFTWANFILVILAMFNKKTKEHLQKEGLSVPLWVHFTYDFIICGVLAAFGWFGYAGMAFFAGLMQGAMAKNSSST